MGRISLSELITYYAAKPVEIIDPVLLIRINKLYRHGMAAGSLYEATRGIWKVGLRREGAKYALAVFEGVVREIYSIESWHSAGTTSYSTRNNSELRVEGRWEFTGTIGPESVRDRYLGRSVAAYFKRGQRSSVTYVNC